MQRTFTRIGALLGAAVVAVLVCAGPASAHEPRTVAGKYHVEVGWGDEPTYVGFKNSIQFLLNDADDKSITDLGDTLKAEVSSAGQTITLPFEANFDEEEGEGTPGDYRAWIIPTRSGEYTVRLTGTVHGDNIDEKFKCSDSTFDCPQEPTAVQFPAKDPSNGQLATNLRRVNPRVDNAVELASANKEATESADDKASTAQILGIVGIVAAIALGGAALFVALRAGRRRSAS